MPQAVRKQYVSRGGEWVEVPAGSGSGGGGSGGGVQPGAIVSFAGVGAPEGWLVCDGSTATVAAYPALFAACGTRYGGDGVTTFNLPNLSGRVPVGVGDPAFGAVGDTGGEKEHLLTEAESGLKEHIHELRLANSEYANQAYDDIVLRAGVPGPVEDPLFRTGTTKGFTGSTGGSNYDGSADINRNAETPHNNIQPFITLTYIIKT